MDLLTEAGGHCVHEEASGRALDVDIVGKPVSVDRDMQYAVSCIQSGKSSHKKVFTALATSKEYSSASV